MDAGRAPCEPAADVLTLDMVSPVRTAASAYEWIPGQGPDPEAFARMVKTFAKPKRPMGEAWFMSESRRMFNGLMALDPCDWPRDELADALRDLSSGPHSFGHLDEWSQWFPFLLHAAQPLIGDWDISGRYGLLVSAIMVHCPDSRADYYYPEFMGDVLRTVGKLPMRNEYWRDGHLMPDKFITTIERSHAGYFLEPSDAFSAAMFLVMKYLHEDALAGWMASVVAIGDPFWRAKLVSWLAVVAPLVFSNKWPDSLEEGLQNGGWESSYSVSGSAPCTRVDPEAKRYAFFDAHRSVAIVDAVRKATGKMRLVEWQIDLEKIGTEAEGLEGIILQFEQASERVVTAYELT
jgi:hypothetical protein